MFCTFNFKGYIFFRRNVCSVFGSRKVSWDNKKDFDIIINTGLNKNLFSNLPLESLFHSQITQFLYDFIFYYLAYEVELIDFLPSMFDDCLFE